MSQTSHHPSTPPAGEKESPFASRGFQVSAAFVAGLVILGGVVVFTGDDGEQQATPSPSEHTDTPDKGGSGPGCGGLSDRNQSVPKSAPAGVSWDLATGGFAVPSSKKAGPAKVHGEVARCYAHTPTGALLAAVQITARTLAAKDWRTVVDAQTVGAGKAAYVKKRAEYEKSEGSAALGNGDHGQIAGFKFVTYNRDTAVIDLVWRAEDGALTSGTSTMLWSGGDWKNEIAESPAPSSPVNDLAGFVAWGGV